MSDPEQQEIYDVFAKAQTVDPEIRAYVYSLITALGGTGVNENGDYVLGDDGLACLRDLKRWLKVYDEKNNRLDVARCLAEADLVNGDILPILATWMEEEEEGGSNGSRSKLRVALACLELLVPLTWPLENAGGEMTVNHHRHTPYIQLAQVRYKAGVLGYGKADILRTVVRIGVPSIAAAKEDRTSRDEGIIKLMLYFFRNISVITSASNLPSQGLEDEVSRSATIEAFREQDVFALLLTLCSNMGDDFNLQDVILLDIIFNLIKGVNVEGLFLNESQRKAQKTSDLKDVLGKEKGMHRDYAKVAPTRHGRFGTMIWMKREDEKMSTISGQDNLKDDRNSLLKMDKSKKWSKPQQRRKDLVHSIHDFDRTVRLNSTATELLRNFVEEFLDSGFNSLFIHLRKAIEREAERLLDFNYRQFFYTVSWFLQAERCRRLRQKKDRGNQKVHTDFEAEDYGLVAGVLNQETFIALNRYMQISLDNKDWQDLNASMKCFTQILLTVQEMAQSSLEDDQEIADNIQNRIFYEETTHDRIATILKGYKDQGFGYLDACTELSHVFLRLLERYSKENADLQIRARRRAQRKTKAATKRKHDIRQRQDREGRGNELEGAEAEDEDEEQGGGQSEAEDLAEAAQVSRERRFDFTRFTAKFTTQSSVDTFVAFAAFYRDLSVEQLKRAHRFFHRVAFKQELAVLLFRVDIVALFYKMIKGPEGLERSHPMFKEWDELVRQVLRRLFRKLEQRPELMVEMLFSKIRATMYYLEYGHEKQITASSRRLPAEMEVKPAPGRDVSQQIGIVIAALVDDEQETSVRWALENIIRAGEERTAWEARATAGKDQSDSYEAGIDASAVVPKANGDESISPVIVLRSTSDEIHASTARNAKFKLLLRLCGFERQVPESHPDTPWIIPSKLSPAQLSDLQTTIEKYLETKWTDLDGNTKPEDLLRRIKQPVVTSAQDGEDEPRRDAFIDDSEGSDEVQDFMFPANVRSKSDVLDDLKRKHKKGKLTRRKRKLGSDDGDDGDPIDQDVLDERKKVRTQAALDRRRKIKSALYIRDSDEEMDENENRAFFAREEENRKRQATTAYHAMRAARGTQGPDDDNIDDLFAEGADEDAVEEESDNEEEVDSDSIGNGRKWKTNVEDDDSVAGKPRKKQERRQGGVAGDETGIHVDDAEVDAQDIEMIDTEPHPPSSSSPSHATQPLPFEDDEAAGETTPATSQSRFSDAQPGKEPSTALREIRQPRVLDPRGGSTSKSRGRGGDVDDKGGDVRSDDDDDDDDDDSEAVETLEPPISSSIPPSSSRMQKQRVRAGFMFDDSDEE